MDGDVVSIEDAPRLRRKGGGGGGTVVQGDAFCPCGHTWLARVELAEAGSGLRPDVRLECPACRRQLGLFRKSFVPVGEETMFCEGCDNTLFLITRRGFFCPNCARYVARD